MGREVLGRKKTGPAQVPRVRVGPETPPSTEKKKKREDNKEDGERWVGEIETRKEDARCLDGGQEQERRCLCKHSFSLLSSVV
jgi:hypothetical protein